MTAPLTGVRSFFYFDRAMLLAFVASRLIVLVAAIAAEQLIRSNPALTSGDSAPLLRSLTAWDGWWYLAIARDGYHADPLVGGYHDYAFLPLYPLLVRLLALPWPAQAGLVAVVLSNALTLAAMGLLARLLISYVTPATASRAASLLVLAPFAAVLAMAYAESLFIALSIGAFLAVERGHRTWAGVLVGAAALARLQGALLVLPLWLLAWRRDGRLRLAQAWLVVGPVAALAYMGFVAWLAGSSDAFQAAQGAWGRTGIGSAAAEGSLATELSAQNLVSLVTLCGAVFLFVFARPDRIPVPYVLVCVLYLGSVFVSGILESVGRYALAAFPFFWILALRRPPALTAWVALSSGLLLAVAAASFAGYLVP